MDAQTLDTIAKVYELVVEAGVYRAPSIKVAEAAKVIENSQRDINIAFMNELSIIFNKMGINTKEVLEAASTKWKVGIALVLIHTTLRIKRNNWDITLRLFYLVEELMMTWADMLRSM